MPTGCLYNNGKDFHMEVRPLELLARLKELRNQGLDAEAWSLYLHQGRDAQDPECHLVGCLAALDAHLNPAGALQAVRVALGAAPAGALLCRCLLAEGMALREIGEVSSALDSFSRAINQLDSLPGLRPAVAGAAYYNRALTNRQARRYSEALADYQAAIDAFKAADQPYHLAQALHNLAWLHCTLGDATSATVALARSGSIIVCNDPSWKAYVWHQLIGDLYCRALSPVNHEKIINEACSLFLRSDVPDDVRAHALWIAGKVALQAGQVQFAATLANQGIALAAVLTDSRAWRDCADLLREASEALQAPLQQH